MKSLFLAAALLSVPALAMAQTQAGTTQPGAAATSTPRSGPHATSAGTIGAGAESRSLPKHPWHSGVGAGAGDQHSLRHVTGPDSGE